MPTSFNIVNNKALQFLKTHPSTANYHIKTLGQFFTYLKDSILSLFNTNHKFAYLGNKSVAEFNLEHMQKDLNTFLANPHLNQPQNKDKSDALQYSFDYLQNQIRITPNFYDIYRSGSLEPNELISQLINYNNKLKNKDLNNTEKQYFQTTINILEEVRNQLDKFPNSQNLINKISYLINK
ncbi:hypothetical protein I5F07_10690 [Proteus vulgaris]|nr:MULTISPECIES: hypothetical protein [Proteus]NBN75844.1 hypothetical protein [Proteus sp. G2615]RNT30308.1 hypothetical protein B9475_003430 [Proteus mirabilis]AYY82284.1 hypothetical protein EGX81_15990 [Proteus vulgaris]KGA58069.1 hypothetical protein DR95_2682 [Proteus vulgaris]MBG5970117.1 hypothetical protein [Proteus vulgaris]